MFFNAFLVENVLLTFVNIFSVLFTVLSTIVVISSGLCDLAKSYLFRFLSADILHQLISTLILQCGQGKTTTHTAISAIL